MNDIRYDFFGQEIQVGDTVIWGTSTNEGRGFNYGVVSEFKPKMVLVSHVNKKGMKWNRQTESYDFDCMVQNLCYAKQLCKIDSELVTLKLMQGK